LIKILGNLLPKTSSQLKNNETTIDLFDNSLAECLFVISNYYSDETIKPLLTNSLDI